MEQKKIAKMLDGLYEWITKQGSEAAELKRLERAKNRTEADEILGKSEKQQTEEPRRNCAISDGSMKNS